MSDAPQPPATHPPASHPPALPPADSQQPEPKAAESRPPVSAGPRLPLGTASRPSALGASASPSLSGAASTAGAALPPSTAPSVTSSTAPSLPRSGAADPGASIGRREGSIDRRGLNSAVDRSLATIEFDPQGNILAANENFLRLMGYALDDIKGKHHRIFVDAKEVESPSYPAFWKALAAGEGSAGEYRRLGRNGREVWIRASYNPIRNEANEVIKVIKFAFDVTEEKHRSAEATSMMRAVSRVQSVIEFDLQGNILSANDNFLRLMGYELHEVAGQHHRMFCTEEYTRSPEYKRMWPRLAQGEVIQGQFKRITKQGREVWLQSSYNPILDASGDPYKVVKFATDITESKLQAVEFEGLHKAVMRAQAVIEFTPTGEILHANDLFLDTMGYSLPEIKGKHHRMFVEPLYATTDEYKGFWGRLGTGEFTTGIYKRVDKHGKDIWLQATYNPIFDTDGRVYKVVKFAYDVTRQKSESNEAESRLNAIDRTQAVVEFDLKGHIVNANENFLKTMGYTLEEIRGKHHRIFCESGYASSDAYANFWDRLGRGESEVGEFHRIARNGRDVWLQANYNPILDLSGRPTKIIKYAQDVTQSKLTTGELQSKVDAVNRGQGVIEFTLEGVVLSANDNFLRAMGYTAREVVGQHHSMFCTAEYQRSEEYRDFWLKLSRGEILSGRYHRIGKFGRDVWIQSSYNPVYDLTGKPIKVVKFAYDITQQVMLEREIQQKTSEMETLHRQLTDSISQIAQTSGRANGLAGETQANAETGAVDIQRSAETIAMIQKTSNEITEIAQVMSDLASQTNLLAFNAAIEAARAGEHGVGFSVVAGEVRRLAERSSDAARNISRLIQESAERIRVGAEVSTRAGQAFSHILKGVQGTAEAIQQIAKVTEHQRKAADTVNDVIAALSNAAGVRGRG